MRAGAVTPGQNTILRGWGPWIAVVAAATAATVASSLVMLGARIDGAAAIGTTVGLAIVVIAFPLWG